MNKKNNKKPDTIQDYTQVCKEILAVLNKYEITYWGFLDIMEAIKNEIDCYTYINVNQDSIK